MQNKKEEPDDKLAKRMKSMSDDELFDELKRVVNKARFETVYDRKLTIAVGKECRTRGWLKNIRMPALWER